ERQVREQTRWRLVERLKQPAAIDTAVDHRARQRQDRRDAAIDAPAPARIAERVEAVRVAEVQERLGLAVAALLPDIRLDRIAPEVPHHGRGAPADAVAEILQAPADVDVVPGGAVHRVEAPDLLER